MSKKVQFEARSGGDAVTWHGPDGKPAKEHKLHVGHGEPAHTIEFTLKDQTGRGLSFDQSDPIHVWESEGCPPAGIDTDQIQLIRAEPENVAVLNRNSGRARTLTYQLNVIDADGRKWPCDPIIRNDGGGGTTGTA